MTHASIVPGSALEHDGLAATCPRCFPHLPAEQRAFIAALEDRVVARRGTHDRPGDPATRVRLEVSERRLAHTRRALYRARWHRVAPNLEVA